VARGWRRLRTEELHNFYASPYIIRVIKSRRIRWAGHVARIGDKRNACDTPAENPEGKRQLGRYRGRWEDNTRMDLREIGWEYVDWIYLAQDRD
jgi:hypothetical protein